MNEKGLIEELEKIQNILFNKRQYESSNQITLAIDVIKDYFYYYDERNEINEVRKIIKKIIQEEVNIEDWRSKSIKQFLQEQGFEILKNGVIKYGNVEAVLWLQRDLYVYRGSLYMSEVGSSEKKIVTLEIIKNLGDMGGGVASFVLDKIVEAAKATGTTIKLFPKKTGKKGLSTKELENWYKKRGFVKIDDDGVMELKN